MFVMSICIVVYEWYCIVYGMLLWYVLFVHSLNVVGEAFSGLNDKARERGRPDSFTLAFVFIKC